MRKLIAVVVVLLVAFPALVAWKERPAAAKDELELSEPPGLRFGGGKLAPRRVVRSGCGYRYRRSLGGVELGLQWLARHQQPDGSWDPLSFAACCTKTTCTGANAFVDRERATTLALLALLGAGYLPTNRASYRDSIDGRVRRFGDTLRRGLVWLLDRQHEDGRIGEDDALSVSRHALATLVLVEVSRGLPRSRIHLAAERAVAWLEAARAKNGGWGFTPRAPLSDSLVTRRTLLALARARSAGFDVATVEATADWTDWSLLEEEPTPSWKAVEALQEIHLRGCAEGSWTGNEGRLVETAWAVLRMERGLRYEVVCRVPRARSPLWSERAR